MAASNISVTDWYLVRLNAILSEDEAIIIDSNGNNIHIRLILKL